jgi:hypothetical protein
VGTSRPPEVASGVVYNTLHRHFCKESEERRSNQAREPVGRPKTVMAVRHLGSFVDGSDQFLSTASTIAALPVLVGSGWPERLVLVSLWVR